jgi:UDP-N-acetylglucosamine 2-epimerase (non-hydrolysing)
LNGKLKVSGRRHRPQIIRLAVLVADTATDHVRHTGQNYDYELNEVFFKDLDYAVPTISAAVGETTAETISSVMSGGRRDRASDLRRFWLSDATVPGRNHRQEAPCSIFMEAGNRC